MRTWLYQLLSTNAGLTAIFGTQFFQGENMTSRLYAKPFLVYTIGNATDEEFSEDKRPYRQFFQIYIHDEPSDYVRIDDAARQVRAVLKNASSRQYGVINVRHLETSRDLDDQTMGTIVRYIRFQAIMEEG